MQKWSRRKSTNFPLLALLFSVFIVASILYNERNIQRIYEDKAAQKQASLTQTSRTERQASITQTSRTKRQASITRTALIPPNISTDSNPKPVPANLDRFTTCSSTRSYGSRNTRRVIRTLNPYDEGRNSGSCDVFSGKWVFDNTSYPLYNESRCPYMSDQLACHKHGRSDLMYQNWRWQPNDCNLKRWNATEMWEKLRNKRLMFVGDSLNRGQWISMVCLLQSVIPVDKRSMSPNAPLTIFRAEEYNATVEFYWAPLLVESNSDDPVNHRLDDRIIRPDSVLKHAAQWEKADILVFNTYLWWRQGPVKLLWSSEENGVCEELDGLGAMELAMEAWADWVASKVDPFMKRIFFITMSPTHLWSREWEPETEGNCYQQKTPINMEGYWGSGSDLPTMRMVETVLSRLSSKVSILNITQLSEYRKDGHPSVYRKFWEPLSPQQLSNPSSYSDCIHWCLPGVPDVWNELLFNFL
ncbi:PMR5 N-terminal domain [Macleaya cordata]|uniref:PMR5 N-terminal domain n=1 Tax=Macleaya cordata TaxID=56857 RepID=A0A200QBJ3_MACCD|nr:PMR5 N-terminal domain [Macleaya cordata]